MISISKSQLVDVIKIPGQYWLSEESKFNPLSVARRKGGKYMLLMGICMESYLRDIKRIHFTSAQWARLLGQDRRNAYRTINNAVKAGWLLSRRTPGSTTTYWLNDQLDFSQLQSLLNLVDNSLLDQVINTDDAPTISRINILGENEIFGEEIHLEAHDERTEYPKKGGNLFPPNAEGRRSLPEASIFWLNKKDFRSERSFSIDWAMTTCQYESEEDVFRPTSVEVRRQPMTDDDLFDTFGWRPPQKPVLDAKIPPWLKRYYHLKEFREINNPSRPLETLPRSYQAKNQRRDRQKNSRTVQ